MRQAQQGKRGEQEGLAQPSAKLRIHTTGEKRFLALQAPCRALWAGQSPLYSSLHPPETGSQQELPHSAKCLRISHPFGRKQTAASGAPSERGDVAVPLQGNLCCLPRDTALGQEGQLCLAGPGLPRDKAAAIQFTHFTALSVRRLHFHRWALAVAHPLPRGCSPPCSSFTIPAFSAFSPLPSHKT